MRFFSQRQAFAPILVIALVIFFSACNNKRTQRYQSFAFGTLIEIKIRTDDTSLADRASATVFSSFDSMHSNWHAWEPGALMQTSNQLATSEWFTADASVLTLIKLAKQYSLLSNGLFNPAIGNLIQLWGFQGEIKPRLPPPQAEINKLLENLPTVNDIDIDGDRMRGHNPQLGLDLGAIAKGFAVSVAIQMLRDEGIEHALINAGGDLCGIGNQGERPWRIGIRDPSGNGVMASVELEDDECVFTSGDYERYFTHNDKRYHHIIDPRSGYPADQVVSVTVLHKNASLADAASTALFIAGPGNWQEIAEKMGVSAVMMVDKKGRVIMTPTMHL